MRLKGVEPSRALAHTDLNRARLPVPPQPRGAGNLPVPPNPPAPGPHRIPPPPPAKMPAPSPLSSRGLGRWLLMPETGVRIPVAVLPLLKVCCADEQRSHRFGRRDYARSRSRHSGAATEPLRDHAKRAAAIRRGLGASDRAAGAVRRTRAPSAHPTGKAVGHRGLRVAQSLQCGFCGPVGQRQVVSREHRRPLWDLRRGVPAGKVATFLWGVPPLARPGPPKWPAARRPRSSAAGAAVPAACRSALGC
jgi:hypothetical protein